MEERQSAVTKRENAALHPLLLLREVARNFWAVLLAAVILGCCGYVFKEASFTPMYQTHTTLVVMQGGSSSVYSNRTAANTLASNLSKLFNGELIRRTIAEELNVDRVDGTISAETISETNLVEVVVTSDDPRMAFQILKAAMGHYNDLGSRSLGNISISVLRPASVPTAPMNYSGSRGFAKRAALVGAALMMALLAVMAFLRDTVKSENEVEEKLDTKLLTVVHHENKAKTLKELFKKNKRGLLITSPTTGFLYVETLKKLRARVEYQMKRTGAKVIMVTSVSENEGKSTIAANLALAMSRKYKNVLLVDGDLKKPALHKLLDYREQDFVTFAELLRGKSTLAKTLLVDPKRHLSALLNRKAEEDSLELLRSERMKQLIDAARSQMDVVIIDTPPMMVSPDSESIAEVADAAILVVRQDAVPVRIINDTIDVLNASHAELLGCVLNNYRITEFSEQVGYGYGGRYGYGVKYGYGRTGYGTALGYGSKIGYGSKLGYGSRLGYGSKLGYGAGDGKEEEA